MGLTYFMGFDFFSVSPFTVSDMHKPGVNQSVLFFVAPFLWSIVGIMLIIRGMHWLESEHQLILLSVALLLGTLKSFFILDKTIKKSVARIAALEDGTCLGAVYSWKSWLLVALMILVGGIVRHVYTPGNLLGTVYCAIGWALLVSSRHGWITWHQTVS